MVADSGAQDEVSGLLWGLSGSNVAGSISDFAKLPFMHQHVWCDEARRSKLIIHEFLFCAPWITAQTSKVTRRLGES